VKSQIPPLQLPSCSLIAAITDDQHPIATAQKSKNGHKNHPIKTALVV
jgi:hypothetical protein